MKLDKHSGQVRVFLNTFHYYQRCNLKLAKQNLIMLVDNYFHICIYLNKCSQKKIDMSQHKISGRFKKYNENCHKIKISIQHTFRSTTNF